MGQAIIRQITASVTFLPLLDEPCSFDLLIYTDKWAEVPDAWDESDPRYIVGGSQEVKLRSFTTKVHKVGCSLLQVRRLGGRCNLHCSHLIRLVRSMLVSNGAMEGGNGEVFYT